MKKHILLLLLVFPLLNCQDDCDIWLDIRFPVSIQMQFVDEATRLSILNVDDPFIPVDSIQFIGLHLGEHRRLWSWKTITNQSIPLNPYLLAAVSHVSVFDDLLLVCLAASSQFQAKTDGLLAARRTSSSYIRNC